MNPSTPISPATVAAPDQALTTRLRPDDPARTTPLLHYFLRLGATGEVGSDGTVTVSVSDETLDVAEALLNWMRVNGAGVTVLDAPRPPRVGSEVFPRAGNGWQGPARLGDLLVAKGRISNEQLGEALVESRANGELLGQVLLRRQWVFEDELARTLAEQWDLPYLNLALVGVDARAVMLLPAAVGTRFAAIPVTFMDDQVQVAFADPSDQRALDAVREHIPATTPAVAEFTDIAMLWRRFAAVA